MAMMSLRVNKGPTLNLSSIFKAAAPDPDLAIKAALANANIWGQEHQNKLWDASTEEKRQLAIKAQQEAETLRIQQAAKDAAGPLFGQVLADATNDPNAPVPVQPPVLGGNRGGGNLLAPGFLESRPAIVSSEAEEKYKRDLAIAEHQRAYARVAGPAIVQLAKDAADYATGTGKGLGAAIVAGNPTPERARTGAMLYTGNIPGKDSVAAAGDFAGVDAGTREAVQTAAGKLPYDIAQDRAKAQAEADAKVAARPLGDSELAIYRAKLAELEAKPPGQLTPEEQQLLPLLKAAVDKADQTALPDKNRLLRPDPNNPDAVIDVPGSAAPPGEAKAFGSTGIEADYNNNLLRLGSKLRRGEALNPDEQDLYGASYSGLAKDHWEQREDSAGKARWVFVKGVVSGRFPDPRQVGEDGRLVGAGTPPPAATGPTRLVPGTAQAIPEAPAVAAPAVARPPPVPAYTAPDGAMTPIRAGDVVEGFNQVKSLTEGEAKDARLVPLLMIAYSHMRDFPPDQLPDAFWQVWTDPGDDPSVAATYIASLAPGPVKEYAQMMNQFSLNLYLLSGAAFPGPERPRNVKTFVPTFGDDANTRHNKFEAMGNIINSIQNNAWRIDPDTRHLFQKQARDIYGVDLNDNPVAPPQSDPYYDAPTDTVAPEKVAPAAQRAIPPMSEEAKRAGLSQADWDHMDEAGWKSWQ